MTEDNKLLVELMLQTEVVCSRLEAEGKKRLKIEDMCALALKIGQCRNAVAQLQLKYEADELDSRGTVACADFRVAVIALLWSVFLAGDIVDAKLYRKVVQVESGFTYLLLSRGRAGRKA